ncbi:hypothetical protein HYALB_00013685 [Hymenoscyphus albidus]|uniref:Ketoreductase domain-containing protein n=1 Tax=Hymenoscyphus albidus TaxID=595503 RepID=A0A9N9LS91_9HELO|nr:hypothetical protein HYALB_00013685 [Hymenoscyphus albidus]
MPPRPRTCFLKLRPPSSPLPLISIRHFTSSPSSSPSPLANQKILITGASRGIGQAIATRFAQEGGRCILVGRNRAVLEEVKGGLACVGDGGREHEHEIAVGDVGQEGFWRGGFRGRKDVTHLINAAGITHSSPLFTTQVSSLESVIQTNLMGTMLACRIVGLGMLKNKQGCIINIASLLGLKGGRGSSAYAASKAGVIGFTRALAAEAGEKGIRVNVIVPGYIETDMITAMPPSARATALNAIPLKRFGTPSEIADAALFLATNAYANNCVLNLDGGLSAM